MLHYVISCYIKLCNIMLHYEHVILCYITLCYIILCYIMNMLYYVTLCYINYVTLHYVTLFHYVT